MASITAGLVGGLLATIVLTMLGDGGPLPTAALVAKFAGGEPDDYAVEPDRDTMMLFGAVHVVCGVVLGGVPAFPGESLDSTGTDHTTNTRNRCHDYHY